MSKKSIDPRDLQIGRSNVKDNKELTFKFAHVNHNIRKNSKNFGNSVSIILSEENKKQFWIPEGFAHGFLSLEDDTEVIYKTTNFYSPAHERTISWQDKSINIQWPETEQIIVSEKDRLGKSLLDSDLFDYNEDDFLYQSTRENLNGTEGGRNTFMEIIKSVDEELAQLRREAHERYDFLRDK